MKKIVLIMLFLLTSPTYAGVQLFVNDPTGFAATAGIFNIIDFETLPNGLPSQAGVAISSTFNYDN